jgi:hypothetical protein
VRFVTALAWSAGAVTNRTYTFCYDSCTIYCISVVENNMK